MVGKRYSKADLLDRIRFQAKVLMRTPTQGELVCPQARTYVRRFGSYEAALQGAGLPVPQVRFRWIQKRGNIILLDEYAARRQVYLRLLPRMFLATLESGYAILRDSVFVGIRDPEGDLFTQPPQAKLRMLTIYLGRRKARALPEFPLSREDILSYDFNVVPAFAWGLSVGEVHRIASTAVSDITIEQLAERLTEQVGAELDRKVFQLQEGGPSDGCSSRIV